MFFTSTKYSCQATDVKSDSQARMRNSRGGPLKMVISMKAFFRTKIFGLLFFSFFFFFSFHNDVFSGDISSNHYSTNLRICRNFF